MNVELISILLSVIVAVAILLEKIVNLVTFTVPLVQQKWRESWNTLDNEKWLKRWFKVRHPLNSEKRGEAEFSWSWDAARLEDTQ